LKPRSDTRKPYNPHTFFLDEGLSGPRLCKLLADAGIVSVEYESLLPRNERTPDESVFAVARAYNHVVLTKDKAMERDEIESIVFHAARLIILTDKVGGVPHFAAAIICARQQIERILLETPVGPLVIRLSSEGKIVKIRGAAELQERYAQFVKAQISRGRKIEKKHQQIGSPSRTTGL
jgi:predicted nuclease of predicted toxin-antitoxin system